MSSELSLKVHPELAAATMRTRTDKGFVLWLLAKALDGGGSGFVSRSQFIEELVRRELYSEQTLLRQMKYDALNLFWQEVFRMDRDRTKSKALRYIGLLRLAEQFKCQRLRPPICVPLLEMGRTLHQRRAMLNAVAAALPMNRRANPISRAFFEDYVGRERTTQQRYEKTARVRVIPNFCSDHIHPQQATAGRLPSSRYHGFIQLRPGLSRKHQAAGLDYGEAGLTRLYFATRDRAIKYRAKNNTDGGSYALQGSQGKPWQRSRLLWEVVT